MLERPGGGGIVNSFVHVDPASAEYHNGAFLPGPHCPETELMAT